MSRLGTSSFLAPPVLAPPPPLDARMVRVTSLVGSERAAVSRPRRPSLTRLLPPAVVRLVRYLAQVITRAWAPLCPRPRRQVALAVAGARPPPTPARTFSRPGVEA